MKKTKRRLETVSFYDHKGIATHLEKMARKGWMIKRMSNLGWIYEAMEPQELHFSVSYYPKASEFDPEPTEGQRTFQEFCAYTGWELVCTSAQMQIFYNARENPIPIETDPVMEVQTLHAACKKNFLPAYWVMLVYALLLGTNFVGTLYVDPIRILSSPINLFTGVCWVLLLILSATELAAYYTWRKKAIAAAEQGVFLDTYNTSVIQRVIQGILCIGVIYVAVNVIFAGDAFMQFAFGFTAILWIGIYAAADGTKQWLKRKKVSRNWNRIISLGLVFLMTFFVMNLILFGGIALSRKGFFAGDQETYEYRGETWVVHKDEIPMRVEDLLDIQYDDYMTLNSADESIFLIRQDIQQRPRFDAVDYKGIPNLNYTVITVKMPWLYRICRDWMFDDLDELDNEKIPYGHRNYLREVDPEAWGAVEAYNLTNQEFETGETRKYLLCYEHQLVEIRFDWDVTQEQKTIVGQFFG